jgi:hypothetical protein
MFSTRKTNTKVTGLSLGALLLALAASFHAIAASELPVSFRGAELYADVTGNSTIVVHLKKYYDLGYEQTTETERVTLFETGTMMSREIELKKESSTVQENKHLQSPNHPKAGTVAVMVYSAEVKLGPGRASYDVTWGYQFLRPELKNIDHSNKGIALAIHIDDNGSLQENTMPVLTTLPAFVFGVNSNASNRITSEDKEQDKLAYYVSSPLSIESTVPDPKAVNDGGIRHASEGNAFTGRLPLKEVKYADAFKGSNPVGAKRFSVDETTGAFDCYTGDKTGKYLAAITIKEKRDNKIISEHQCVFVIDVQY